MKALNKAGSRLQDMKKAIWSSATNRVSTRSLYIRSCALKVRRERSMCIPRSGALYYGKFEDLMEKLDSRFTRCHNSYIVNLTKVRELSDKKIRLRKWQECAHQQDLLCRCGKVPLIFRWR